MADDPNKINELLEKLNTLLEKQELFQKEINELRDEIKAVRSEQRTVTPPEIIKETPPMTKTWVEIPEQKAAYLTPADQEEVKQAVMAETEKVKTSKPLVAKEDWEKFIGENLINKIGIVITVIGVGIGAKYAIEHQLISPLTRIILGYLVGVGLLGFAIKLKKNYESFSAVLLSGAMAIMYLITFSAYSFYNLIPQTAAFGLMVMFTAFTVLAALNYNRQVIAHIGLVGAYGVPFLLSDGSGRVLILFSYMAIINTGILVIAIKKYWKPLFYASFLLTWAIYLSWFFIQYNYPQHYRSATIFVGIFFLIFYVTFLVNKLLTKEKFTIDDIVLVLSNSFVFFGVGYALIDEHPKGHQLLGMFTLVNAIIHFAVSTVIYRNKLADRNLLYLVSGLVLVFITIAIPVQLNGHWVTLLWAGEAAVLFWIGRTKGVTFYEVLSYPLMALAFVSLMQDWAVGYNSYVKTNPASRIAPVLNIHFLSSLLFIFAFGFIQYINSSKKYLGEWLHKIQLHSFITYAIPLVLVWVLFGSGVMEISCYWDQLYTDSPILIKQIYQSNDDLPLFKYIWLINYSMLFVSALSLLNILKLKSERLSAFNLTLNVISLAAFLVLGLYFISDLRQSYLDQTLAKYYYRGTYHLLIRYISYGCAALLVISTYLYTRRGFLKIDLKTPFEIMFHTTILWIASSELINWLSLARLEHTYKLELSLLWGFYAVLLIVLGIWQKKRHLRIGAILLFAVTLFKLFMYDISFMDTIAKTIVFVSLGILLLIISFLYNKYKNKIAGEPNS